MAEIAVEPFVLRDALLTLGTNGYKSHVSSAAFKKQGGEVVTFQGMTPSAKKSFPTEPTWTLDMTFAQDTKTADSLFRYLFENAGEEVAAVFEPVNGDPGASATIILTAPDTLGGDVNTVGMASASCGVQGPPILAPIV